MTENVENAQNVSDASSPHLSSSPPAAAEKKGGGFGDFQENVGKIGATFNEIGAWIAFGICVIISGVMVVNAVKGDPNDPRQNKTANIILALIPVGIGLLILVFAHWWRKVVSHNRGAAQFAGLVTESNMLGNIIHGPPSNGFNSNGFNNNGFSNNSFGGNGFNNNGFGGNGFGF